VAGTLVAARPREDRHHVVLEADRWFAGRVADAHRHAQFGAALRGHQHAFARAQRPQAHRFALGLDCREFGWLDAPLHSRGAVGGGPVGPAHPSHDALAVTRIVELHGVGEHLQLRARENSGRDQCGQHRQCSHRRSSPP
jgi:hypothetical protein